MSDSNILEKITRRDVSPSLSDSESEADDLGSFGWLRGNRDRALMLEFRRKNGSVQAWCYALLQKIDFDPSASVTLWFPGHKIIVHGKKLNEEVRPNIRLFEGLTRHKVPWIQEIAELDRFAASTDMTVVDRIEW